MMIKSFLIGLSLILFSLNEIKSLDIDKYVSQVHDLFLDEEVIKEFEKWTSKLYSDPEYTTGIQLDDFPCTIPSEEVRNDPINIHSLRPSDVQCVGAIGDSLTAGLGTLAKTPIGLFTEWRGLSWSVGGDESFDTVLTLPNILRKYNPNLKGFSTKTSLTIGLGQNSSHNGLNVAQSGDKSNHMPGQAGILKERLDEHTFCDAGHCCDIQNDWKIITFFIGGNDLCNFCFEEGHDPVSFTNNVRETLDFLHANFPRTFVNLVLILDFRHVEELNAGGLFCSLMHRNTCPCCAYPSDADREALAKYIPEYKGRLIDLINSGRYDTKDDFTVVIQPFMADTPLPRTPSGDPDYSYFAPDCFHFSAKGQSQSALSLWNNMVESVGQKLWKWHEGEKFECPTQDRPFFATRLNSPQSFEKIPK